MPDYFIFADIIGICAFSISGFLVAIKNDLDILGIVIAASLTALGGGIIRDALLDAHPFAFTTMYPALALSSSLIFAFIFRLYNKPSLEQKWLFVISDTIGLVAFSIAGAILAIHAEYNPFGVVILGFITAVGGGLVRDVMINKVPAVLISDFYGSISVIVALSLAIVAEFDFLDEIVIIGVGIFSILLRLIAYKNKWHLPKLS